MNRRSFLLNGTLATLACAAGAACNTGNRMVTPNGNDRGYRSLYKPILSEDRIVKETVGLRPFRLSGPRLDVETIGTKTVVHNYGHGGSGVSLSWGTGEIASNNALQTGEKEIAVIGCGVSGLTTARLLQEKGAVVTIYTKARFPNVTSALATGTWSPSYTLCEKDRINGTLLEWWETASRFSFRQFQHLLGTQDDMVRWIQSYAVSDKRMEGAPPSSPFNISGIGPKPVDISNSKHPFNARYVSLEEHLTFNLPQYMDWLTAEFRNMGGKILIKEFFTPDDLGSLKERTIVNCTGLGSHALLGDTELMPVSGQLAFLIPQKEIRYMLRTSGGYLIPRKDGIVLGGNSIKGNWDTTPDHDLTLNMIRSVNRVVQTMKGSYV